MSDTVNVRVVASERVNYEAVVNLTRGEFEELNAALEAGGEQAAEAAEYIIADLCRVDPTDWDDPCVDEFEEIENGTDN